MLIEERCTYILNSHIILQTVSSLFDIQKMKVFISLLSEFFFNYITVFTRKTWTSGDCFFMTLLRCAMFWVLCIIYGTCGFLLVYVWVYRSVCRCSDEVKINERKFSSFTILLFLMTKYYKLLKCIIFYWCTNYWQFSMMIIFIFARSFRSNNNKTNLFFFFFSFVFEVAYEQFVGLFWWKCSRGFITINLFWGCV